MDHVRFFRFPFFISTHATGYHPIRAFRLLVVLQLMPVATTQLGQANLSKTKAHTEAPMTHLGSTAAAGPIADRVSFVWCCLAFDFSIQQFCDEDGFGEAPKKGTVETTTLEKGR